MFLNLLIELANNIDTETILNIPRTYTAIAEWLACLVFIVFTKRRFNKTISCLISIGFLGLMIAFQVFAGTLSLYWWVPGMIFAVFLMFLFVYTISQVSVLRAIYITVQAFIIAEFVASIEWQLYYFFISQFWFKDELWMSVIWMVVIYLMLFLGAYLLEKRYYKFRHSFEIRISDITTAILIAVVIFAISNMSFISTDTPISGTYPTDIFYIRTLVDLAGVILIYTQREHKLAYYSKVEVDSMQNLLEKQYEQYYQYQENIDIVNRQYHDLKHQIDIIRMETDVNKREQYLRELEAKIKPFETNYQTGNNVIDIMLTSKSAICLENEISFTAVVDGNLLDFISEMDLSLIFGNALDNAIEGSLKISDEEKSKRIIKVKVHAKNQFTVIRFENYYDSQLRQEQGVFLTTKKQQVGHGYGIKSMKTIVDKYHGSMKITTENNWFTLTILFPNKQ